jgi:D-alanine-D-alanine ligase
MRSGAAMVETLRSLGYAVKDVVITRDGEWLERGLVQPPAQILMNVDVVCLALHGQYGEDGEIQKLLQRLHVPFTGSRSFPSARAFNKHLTKELVRQHGIQTPASRRVTRSDLDNLEALVTELNAALGNELFLKPVSDGSSIGAEYVPSLATLRVRLPEVLEAYDAILIEEYIRGREATVGVLEGFRGEPRYVLPVVEIVTPRGAQFYDHTNKYNGATQQHCPARFSYAERQQLADLAALAHDVLDLSQYSRSDFIVRDGEVYFLETNTLPGFTPTSNFPLAAAAVGLTFPELVRYLVETATV